VTGRYVVRDEAEPTLILDRHDRRRDARKFARAWAEKWETACTVTDLRSGRTWRYVAR
jgi:hypothetical protein